jgi:hypothetical protein
MLSGKSFVLQRVREPLMCPPDKRALDFDCRIGVYSKQGEQTSMNL